jgi:hypothetical protein
LVVTGLPYRGQMLACVVQVYFEQFLPTDDSWPEQFGLEAERFKVLVAPRQHGNDLFPEAIDRTLATMEFTLTPVSRPGAQVVTRVGERMVDRIGLTVIDDSSSGRPTRCSSLPRGHTRCDQLARRRRTAQRCTDDVGHLDGGASQTPAPEPRLVDAGSCHFLSPNPERQRPRTTLTGAPA